MQKKGSRYFYLNKYYLKNDNFFINKGGSNFEKVVGIKLKGFKEIELFLHKTENGKLSISESSSGFRISGEHKSKRVAELFVKKLISKFGERKFINLAEEKIEGKFLSPRFSFVVNPNRQICGILNT